MSDARDPVSASRVAILALVFLAGCLSLPASALAHGDLASQYLSNHSVFVPLTAKIDEDAAKRLATVVREAEGAGFDVKVALIAQPADLGSLTGLYLKPQRYAEFLSLDLGNVSRPGLLVVMPNGFGYKKTEGSDARLHGVLVSLGAPGRDTTKQAEAAAVAVRRLAAADGHPIGPPMGGSENTDRITIAAAATAGIALLAGLLLYRRQRREPET